MAIIRQKVGLIIFLIAPVFFVSCGWGSSGKEEYLSVSVREPVDRGWKEIKKDGVLKMITRYSSNTYFLHQGLQYGFEYELLKRFAKEQGLAFEVVVMKPDENPYNILNSGKGDIIAANYAITDIRERVVDFTRPYNVVSQLLVFSDTLNDIPRNVKEVARRNIPVTVRPNSSYYHRLLKLEEQGFSFNINLVSNKNHTEALLIDVAQGKYMATVADDNIFQSVNSYLDHLVKGPMLEKKDKIAWAVRKNADKLRDKLNKYLSKHFRIKRGEIKRSAFLNILRDRYFNRGQRLTQYYNTDEATLLNGVISPFDNLFKNIADSAGIDWRMLAAIAAQESHFNPNATGWSGAIGLMQIMPQYATVDSVTLYNPRINVWQSVRILKNHLATYSYIPESDRWRFVLAAYNAGQGHLRDARRLAMDAGHNPNNWKYIEKAFLKLMDRKFYQNARHGFCRGILTVEYVGEIMSRYKTYKTIMTLASPPDYSS